MDIKLLSNKDKKIAIQAELIAGANVRKLAEKYDVHYTTMLGYRNELREGVAREEVLAFTDVKEVALHSIAENVKSQSAEVLPPKKAKQFNNAVDEMVEGVNSLQLLDTAFHNTITRLLTWADNQITDDIDYKTWNNIATRIGELHKAVFANGGVQVNVQQNNANNSFSAGMTN